MSQITKLKQDIQEIEDEAGQLDPTDYEALYKLLAVAYFKAKDIIELHDEVNPVIKSPVEDGALVEANAEIVKLIEFNANAIKDIEILREEVMARDNTLSNISKELDKLTT